LYVEAVGVPASTAQTFTVTVPLALTYPENINPSPGYVFGETCTVIVVKASGKETVPLAHCPALSGAPAMLAVVAMSGNMLT